MTVKEYALEQLHWLIRRDPWVREIFLAAGAQLDALAERILAIYHFDDFSNLTLAQVNYYEKILGLPTDSSQSLEDRRAAIQAAWNIAQKPTVEALQAVCDAWESGGIIVEYEPGTVHLHFIGAVGVPANLDALKRAIGATVPAHLIVDYDFRYLLIREVHQVMTLAEMNETPLNHFAGG